MILKEKFLISRDTILMGGRMEALAMVIGSAVAYLVLSGRKEKEWEEQCFGRYHT
jgi:hypothetical protein